MNDRITLTELSVQSGISRKILYREARRLFPHRFVNGLTTLMTFKEAECVVDSRRFYEHQVSSIEKLHRNRQ